MKITLNTPVGKFSVLENDLFYHDMKGSNTYAEQSIIDVNLAPIIQKSTYILDIGSHVGYHTLAYAKINPNIVVVAFEPQKEIYDLLNENIAQNHLADRVKTANKCVGHKSMKVCLSSNVDDGPNTDKNISYDGSDIFNMGGLNIGIGGTEVDMIALDDIYIDNLDYMKVDVEGAEPLVFLGAENTIKRFKPVICFENLKELSPAYLSNIGIQGKVGTAFDILGGYGYNSFEEIGYNNVIAKMVQ